MDAWCRIAGQCSCRSMMGRKTWESLKKPLTNRFNIIISSKNLEVSSPDVKVFKNIDEAIHFSYSKNFEILWVIGGSQIYQTFLNDYNNVLFYLMFFFQFLIFQFDDNTITIFFPFTVYSFNTSLFEYSGLINPLFHKIWRIASSLYIHPSIIFFFSYL